MPMMTSIDPGVLGVVYKANPEDTKLTTQEFAVGRGVLEVGNDTSKVLIDMLVSAENLDKDKAETAKQNALKLMEKYK
jgi:F0F1-type ATP synthase epsilon subunit